MGLGLEKEGGELFATGPRPFLVRSGSAIHDISIALR